MLEESDPLVARHDLVMLDLDGVVYVDGSALAGVPDRLARARRAGAHLGFVTNNAARTPDAVARRLEGMGIEAVAADVVTSAQAAARVLRERHGAGARIVMLGADGLRRALEEQGLVPLEVQEPDGAAAIVTGYGPQVRWSDIMRAAVLVEGGLPYVATNTDHTIPTGFGRAPGHGVLVRTISDFAGVEPVVAGKPQRPLLDETVRRVGGDTPVMVGDRLDTDIEGAHNAGLRSLLVLTGVTGLRELVAAPPRQRPTYIHPDLEGLFEAHPAPVLSTDGRARLNGWEARVEGSLLRVAGSGTPADWWRVVACTAWHHLDASGEVVDVSGAADMARRLAPAGG